MASQIKVDPVVGSIGTVISKSLTNQGLRHEFGALNEKTVVIGIEYTFMVRMALEDLDMSHIKYKIKDGILFVIYEGGTNQQEVENINKQILKKMTSIGIDAKGYISSDGEAILTINLNDLALKILDIAVDKAKMKLGSKMRLIRVKFAHDDKWGYMVIYKKGHEHKSDVDPDDLARLAV